MHPDCTPPLFTISENLHILNPAFRQAIEQEDQNALLQLTRNSLRHGTQTLAITTGPSKAMGAALPWIVESIQREHPTPLFLPALDSPALEQALKVHRGKATINAVTAEPKQLRRTMRLACKYGARVVVLLTRPGLASSDLQQRLDIAFTVLEQAKAIGMDWNQLYLDPILSAETNPMAWGLRQGMPSLEPTLQILPLLAELSGGQTKTILGLSNSTFGLPAEQRSIIHRRILPLLAASGLNAVLLNSRDKELMQVACGLKQSQPLQQKAA